MVLIQPPDRRYNNINGLCNGTTVTNRPRRGGRGRRFYRYTVRYRDHMTSTGRDLKHRTHFQGPYYAHTAVRLTVQPYYTWPCNGNTVTNCACVSVCAWGGGCGGAVRTEVRAVCRASHACVPPQQIPGSRAGPRPASVVCALAGQLPLGQTYISCPREADFFYKFLRYFFRITVDFQKFFCAVPNCDCRSLRGLFAVCCHKHAVGIIFVI